MKKYIKIGILVLIALIFIGTFVFLYQKSQPQRHEVRHSESRNHQSGTDYRSNGKD